MSVRCGESTWLKSVVNGLRGVEVPVAGKVREMEARVLFNPANRLIPYGLTETPGMPGDAPDGLEPSAFSSTNNRIAGGNWTYNARGDIETDGEGKKHYYDAEGRLAAVCASSVTVANCSDVNNWDVRYVYDGQGQRVRKDLSNGSSVLYEYDAQGGLVAEYGSAGTAGTQYLTVDHLGSTRVVTDAAQGVVGRYDYEPFGRELLITSASWRSGVTGYAPVGGLSQRFTGKERDAETGLDYFGARYMSAAQGRWTSPDAPFADQRPADPQSWNLYSYVRNNPLRHTDPTGRCILSPGVDCFDFFVGAAKAVANIVPGTATLVNRAINRATGTQIPDAPTLKPANSSEAEGMNSAAMVLIFTPIAEAGVARTTTAAVEMESVGAAQSETAVIGRVKDLNNLQPGEASLLDRLPDLGSVKANWKQNAGVLREEMGRSLPIRDASPGDVGGQFLNAERNLLRDRGWTFESRTSRWIPPVKR